MNTVGLKARNIEREYYITQKAFSRKKEMHFTRNKKPSSKLHTSQSLSTIPSLSTSTSTTGCTQEKKTQKAAHLKCES